MFVATAGAPPPKFANGSDGAAKLIGEAGAAGAAGATGAAGAGSPPAAGPPAPGPPNMEKISPPPPNKFANIELKSNAFPCSGGACCSAGAPPPTERII